MMFKNKFCSVSSVISLGTPCPIFVLKDTENTEEHRKHEGLTSQFKYEHLYSKVNIAL